MILISQQPNILDVGPHQAVEELDKERLVVEELNEDVDDISIWMR